jgi:F-type H+-transporting ATPase subunit gamma
MARPRVLSKRIKSVRSIHKITKTMQWVAQSRSLKIQGKTARLVEFSAGLERLLGNIRQSAAAGIGGHPWCIARAVERKIALLVITSNRGLCGGYNTRILQAARERIRSLAAEGKGSYLYVIGKKGIAYFRFIGQAVDKATVDVNENVDFPKVEPVIAEMVGLFVEGQVDAVETVSMRYRSRGRQEAAVTRLLPFSLGNAASAAASKTAPAAGNTASAAAEAGSLLIEPDPARMLGGLIPLMLKARFFSLLLEAFLSEQMQRTLAMTNATENADSMIKRLTREYNRARQAQITGEMIEIIGGSEGTKR